MRWSIRAMALAGMAGLIAMTSPQPSEAAKLPRALPTDARVRQVLYDPNQVYEIVGTYGYQTALEFAADELVKVVSLGDSIAWQAVPYRNRLFLKPVEPNASTNLTVVTDKRSYFFGLRGTRGAGATYLVRFVYPRRPGPFGAKLGESLFAGESPCLGAPVSSSAAVNRRYSTAGDRAAVPLRHVCDDGQFTYFRFDADAEIPAVYVVGPDGAEALVNTRRERDYLVVERRASRFTLRNGTAYLCVLNDAMGPSPRAGSAGARPIGEGG